ncbi:hypothetical protein PV783_11645 [Chitinophaga sp. CC14]|uniref:hypothetical protein n=1 Tax=Chitinophaga sp. CC14 TaxID=3029199 RepID=UPI003B7676BC
MSNAAIRNALRQLTGTDLNDQVSLLVCNVDSVDVDSRVCTCSNTSGNAVADVLEVQLMAEVDDGMLCVPKVGSTVIVVLSKYVQPYVAMYSELDRMYTVVGDSIIDVEPDKITLNDGSFAGLVKVITLTQKLNALEEKVNTLINTFNSHVHTGVTTGSSSSGTTSTPVTGTLTPTQQSEIENEKIVHGS